MEKTRARVLTVDDDKDFRDLVRLILEPDGIELSEERLESFWVTIRQIRIFKNVSF